MGGRDITGCRALSSVAPDCSNESSISRSPRDCGRASGAEHQLNIRLDGHPCAASVACLASVVVLFHEACCEAAHSAAERLVGTRTPDRAERAAVLGAMEPVGLIARTSG